VRVEDPSGRKVFLVYRDSALRREAQSTSALEGTYAPFADVLAALDAA